MSAHPYQRVSQIIAERDALRAVNAELLAALERIDGMACYASEENTDAKDDVLLMIGTHARAAIARATAQESPTNGETR